MTRPIPLLLAAGALLHASAAPAETLRDALAAAYRDNPQLVAERANVGRTDENVPQALAGWRPHVTVHVESGFEALDNSTDPRLRPERRNPQDLEADLVQNVYTSGRVDAEVKQARLQVETARATLAAVMSDVMLAAGTAYADVARDRALLQLQRKQEDVLAHTVHATGVEARAGQVTDADVAEAEERLANQRAATAAAIATLRASEARYEQQIGHPPDDVSLDGFTLSLPATEADALADAEARNPALVAARDAVAVSRLGVDIRVDQLLPQVSIHGLLQRLRDYQYEMFHQRADAAQVTLVLEMPLYQGGQLYAEIRAAKEGNLQAQALAEQQRRQARALTRTAWSALDAARTRVEESARAVGAGRTAESGLAAQQGVGARTVVDVLIAEQDTLASETSGVAARHDLVVGELGVLAVTGGLTPESLGLATPRYAPEAHFREVREKWAGVDPPDSDAVVPKGPIPLPPP